MTDILYSFGAAAPRALCLHNFPRFLQQYERPDGKLQDLAATDILRTRELGVPRYNEFRRLLHLKPGETFDELTDNPEWAAEIERVYEGDIEAVDLIGRHVRRDAAEGIRVQRHGLPDLRPDGLAAPEQRQVLHDGLHAAGLHEGGMDWIDDNDDAVGAAAPLPRAALRAARPAECVPALAQRRGVARRHAKTFTARAMTRPRMTSDTVAWSIMLSFAQGASGMASVGLNAVAFVKPRYR